MYNNNNQSPILFYFILFFFVRTWLIWCIIALVCNTHLPQYLSSVKELAQLFFFSVCEGWYLTLKDINFPSSSREGWHLIWKVPTSPSSRTKPNQSRQNCTRSLRSITFQSREVLGIRVLWWTHTSQGLTAGPHSQNVPASGSLP